jgi:hypothetical protein
MNTLHTSEVIQNDGNIVSDQTTEKSMVIEIFIMLYIKPTRRGYSGNASHKQQKSDLSNGTRDNYPFYYCTFGKSILSILWIIVLLLLQMGVLFLKVLRWSFLLFWG